MADNGLPIINSNDAGTTAVSDFIDQIHTATAQASQDELALVKEINKLKISNVENITHLQAESERKLIDDYTSAKLEAAKIVNKEERKKSEALIKDLEQQKEEAEKSGDKKKAKRLNRQIKQEQKREKDAAKVRENNAKKEAKETIKNKKKEEQSEKIKAAKTLAHDASLFNKETTLTKKFTALGKSFKRDVYDDNGVVGKKTTLSGVIGGMANMLSDMAKQLDSSIEKVAGYKSKIDTRLQGLNRKTGGFFGGGSA
jgi:hypothetical protein